MEMAPKLLQYLLLWSITYLFTSLYLMLAMNINRQRERETRIRETNRTTPRTLRLEDYNALICSDMDCYFSNGMEVQSALFPHRLRQNLASLGLIALKMPELCGFSHDIVNMLREPHIHPQARLYRVSNMPNLVVPQNVYKRLMLLAFRSSIKHMEEGDLFLSELISRCYDGMDMEVLILLYHEASVYRRHFDQFFPFVVLVIFYYWTNIRIPLLQEGYVHFLMLDDGPLHLRHVFLRRTLQETANINRETLVERINHITFLTLQYCVSYIVKYYEPNRLLRPNHVGAPHFNLCSKLSNLSSSFLYHHLIEAIYGQSTLSLLLIQAIMKLKFLICLYKYLDVQSKKYRLIRRIHTLNKFAFSVLVGLEAQAVSVILYRVIAKLLP